MPFRSTFYARVGAPDHASDTTQPTWSSSRVLSGAQDTLAAIADLETRYEIEREHIVQSSGPEEAKERHLAELQAAYQHDRNAYEQRWRTLYS